MTRSITVNLNVYGIQYYAAVDSPSLQDYGESEHSKFAILGIVFRGLWAGFSTLTWQPWYKHWLVFYTCDMSRWMTCIPDGQSKTWWDRWARRDG